MNIQMPATIYQPLKRSGEMIDVGALNIVTKTGNKLITKSGSYIVTKVGRYIPLATTVYTKDAALAPTTYSQNDSK